MSLTIRSITSLKPLLDRVLVQRLKPETKTASGIFLPSSVTDKSVPEATVVAVGPGARDRCVLVSSGLGYTLNLVNESRDGKVVPMSVSAGDKVLLPGFGGQPIKVGEEEYHLFRDSEILARLAE